MGEELLRVREAVGEAEVLRGKQKSQVQWLEKARRQEERTNHPVRHGQGEGEAVVEAEGALLWHESEVNHGAQAIHWKQA